jgi:SAM-dependent methyltransferase
VGELRAYFDANPGRLMDKWLHYFEIYERHFARYRGREVTVVEFGVFHGGSLQMWKRYFGARARIVGVDIDPRCRELAEERVEVIIGDQADRAFLRQLRTRVPRIDVLIDDGGHFMEQQRATFEELFPHVAADGVYLVEDLHTSYWPGWGGGLRRGETFIEFAKDLIDQLHAWYWREESRWSRLGRALLRRRPPVVAGGVDLARATPFTRAVHGMHFYDSVLVIEKRPIVPPSHQTTGTPSW